MKKSIIWFLLRLISFLPLPVLYIVSDVVYFIVYHLIGYRKKIVIDNISSSFPEKSSKEIEKTVRGFYRFLCDMIVETVKTASISSTELKKRFKVENPEIVNRSLSLGKSTVLYLGHYGNWEWVQEIGTYFNKGTYCGSIYHRMNNRLWDDIFIRLRSRWHMHLMPRDKAVRTLLDKDNRPWAIGFIADQRPRFTNHDNFTEFLNHKTYFFTGPEEIGRRVGADFFYCDISRPRRGYYRLEFLPLEPQADAPNFPYTRAFYKKFQETIERDPALWLWSHKRWKQQ